MIRRHSTKGSRPRAQDNAFGADRRPVAPNTSDEFTISYTGGHKKSVVTGDQVVQTIDMVKLQARMDAVDAEMETEKALIRAATEATYRAALAREMEEEEHAA